MAPKRKAADTGGDGPSKRTRRATTDSGKGKKKAADDGDPGPSKAPKKAPADKDKRKDNGKERAKDGKDDGNAARPRRGIEREPSDDDGDDSFVIKRLIRVTDKAGNEVPDDRLPINMDAEYFSVNYGDFLLELPFEAPNALEEKWSRVRNYEDTPTDPAGVGLPLRFFDEDTVGIGGTQFLAEEAVMLTTEDDDEDDEDANVFVLDYERSRDAVPKTQEEGGRRRRLREVLSHRYEVPWQFPVPEDFLNQWNEYAASLVVGSPDEGVDRAKDTEDNGKGKEDEGKKEKTRKAKDVPEEEEEEEEEEDKKAVKLKKETIRCGRKKNNGEPCFQKVITAVGVDKGCKSHLRRKRMTGIDKFNNKL